MVLLNLSLKGVCWIWDLDCEQPCAQGCTTHSWACLGVVPHLVRGYIMVLSTMYPPSIFNKLLSPPLRPISQYSVPVTASNYSNIYLSHLLLFCSVLPVW